MVENRWQYGGLFIFWQGRGEGEKGSGLGEGDLFGYSLYFASTVRLTPVS